MAAMLPGGGIFFDRLERSGLMGIVGDGDEKLESSDCGLLLVEGEGGGDMSPSRLYATERKVRFMVLALVPGFDVVAVESLLVRCCDNVLGESGAMFRARTGSTDGITAAARAMSRASFSAG